MRMLVKLAAGWTSSGWLWVVALLALPNCTLDRSGIVSPINLDRGPLPRSSAVFCDIEQPGGRRCATDEDLAAGIRLASAAVALATGQSSTIGLDESPAALARCGGRPEAVRFQAPFPEGDLICLNCSVIGPPPARYADANGVCFDRCADIFNPDLSDPPSVPPEPDVALFCAGRARVSTNYGSISTCLAGVCTDGAVPRDDFADPRRVPEPVVWTDLVGVTPAGNSLTRTAPETTPGAFDAGAASTQWVTRGDAFVEFSAAETNLSHVIGFAQIPAGCAFPCPDSDPSLADVNFAVSLNRDGSFYLIESGALLTGPGMGGAFGTYNIGDRFRVSVRDHSDGTATVAYSRVTGFCAVGAPCPENVFFTHTATTPRFPFRVDASFRETGATLSDVRVVRIQ